jgi:hypothetical protein
MKGLKRLSNNLMMRTMRKNIITKLFFVGALAVGASACTEEYDSDSSIATWAAYPVTMETPAVVAAEGDEGTYTFDFNFDEKQITGLVIEVQSGSSSTADEDVDFELGAHEIEIAPLAGQDGFSLDVSVLQDFEIEAGDEDVYLIFHATTPSGMVEQEFKIITIEDSGLAPQPGETADFSVSWAFASELNGADACDVDIDLTIQTQGTDPYDDDLMEFGAASLACPEGGTVTLADMNEGEAYDVWVFSYGGASLDYGVLSDLTVTLEFSRENTDFGGTVVLEDLFSSSSPSTAVLVGTVVRNGNVITFKDGDGAVISEGRVAAKYQVFHNVVKPF